MTRPDGFGAVLRTPPGYDGGLIRIRIDIDVHLAQGA